MTEEKQLQEAWARGYLQGRKEAAAWFKETEQKAEKRGYEKGKKEQANFTECIACGKKQAIHCIDCGFDAITKAKTETAKAITDYIERTGDFEEGIIRLTVRQLGEIKSRWCKE